jgi:hypothetical protein
MDTPRKSAALILTAAFVLLLGSCTAFTPEEKIRTQYAGKWLLVWSSDPNDSLLLQSGWIALQADSQFYCNSSFFWRKDSLRTEPSLGKWTAGIFSAAFPMSHQQDPSTWESFKLIIGRKTQYWLLRGQGRQDSTLKWYNTYDSLCYSWRLLE